jgi:serine/threonine protein kinase
MFILTFAIQRSLRAHTENRWVTMERFHIDRKIGAGAQATAYLAHLVKEPTSLFVLKRLAVEQICLSEMAILHKLNHPAVIRCFDAFTHDGDLFLVLQYADGGDLEKMIASAALRHVAPREVLPLPVVDRMFMQLALGLQYCHEQRTLHRDIKTANILVSKDLSRAMLGDFGVAKQLVGEARVANTMVGTPMTFAPETVSGQGYTYASDIWALGCVLYEMLTFKKPFPYSNLSLLVQKVSAGEFEPLPNSVPSHYRRIIKGMLQVDVNKRYSIQEALGEFSRKAVLTVQQQLQTLHEAAAAETAPSPTFDRADKAPARRPGRRASVAPGTESPRPEPAAAPAPQTSPQKRAPVAGSGAVGSLQDWVKWKKREFAEIDSYLAMFDGQTGEPTDAGRVTPPAQIRRNFDESDDPLSPAYVKPRTPPGEAMNANRAKRLLPSPQALGEKPSARGAPEVVPVRPKPAADPSSETKKERASRRAAERDLLQKAIQDGRKAKSQSLDRDELEAAIGVAAVALPRSEARAAGASPSSGRPPVGQTSPPPQSAPAGAGAKAKPEKEPRSTRDIIREQRVAAQKSGSGSGTFDVQIVLPGNLQHLLPKNA